MKIIARLCALASLLVAASAAAAPDPDAFRASVDRFVQATMSEQKVPGVAVAVLRNGEVIVSKGYGLANVEHKVPVTPATIFQLGSVGKMFTAAAIMRQVEDGKMRLDDPISRYLGDVPPSWGAITIRHLLTHTSGVANQGDDFDLRRDYSDDELVKAAYALPLDFAPGKRWSYSNTGYILLGIIAQKASGRSYLDILKTDVFAPLGMSTARGISDRDIVPNRAAGYEPVKGELKNQDFVSPTMNATADGSLYTSLNDMIAWDRGVMGGKVLSDTSWRQVFAPVRLSSGKPYPYGFAWFIDQAGGKPKLHHSGAWQGFRANYARYLGEGLSVIVLTNSASARTASFIDGIAHAWDPALVALPEKPGPDPAVERRVTALIERARDGKLRDTDVPLAGKGFAAAANGAFAPLLTRLEALQSMELLERRELGDDLLYKYRAAFKNGTATVTYQVAPGDQVSMFLVEK